MPFVAEQGGGLMGAAVKVRDLTPAEVARLDALLDELLDLPPCARAEWQAALAQREPALAEVVAGLVGAMASAAPEGAGRVETAELIARQLGQATHELPALSGRRLGPYRVLRLIGQGGMGSVWLAERADGLFERQVALKCVHAGLFAGAGLAERFARERSILGALEHPHIARLLDAGVADDGQPYLALEYVEGETLVRYCDERRLGLPQRLALFAQVLSAVSYAHQNLVIHRDLKPANILVTPQGEVRLLDFGIAKLMTDGQANETELTQLAGRALTPEYASPEQVAGRAVNTASDVYSLGVVLYGLLCGQRPYVLARESRAVLEEAILSATPLRPSQQAVGFEAAHARGTTPRRLVQALAGDLDTIVLKALKKDPAERYPTADALAQDLQRHLDGQPVLARPDSAAYRLRKFIGRHRLQVAAGSAVAALVFTAAAVSLWQAQVAREQADAARRESLRAQSVQAFLLDIFKANSVQQADPQRARQTTARELLDVGAQRALDSLQGSPEALDEVLGTLADMYFQLGLSEDAARMRLLRVDGVRRQYGDRDVRLADALVDYANDVSSTAQRQRSAAALDEAGRLLDALGDHRSDTRGRYLVERARLQQYTVLKQMRDSADEAVRHYRAHPDTTYWGGLSQALQFAGRSRHLLGDLATAEGWYGQSLAEIRRHQPGDTSSWAITPLVHLAEVQMQMLKLDDAERHLQQAFDASRRLNGDLNGTTLQTQAKLGGYLHAMGRRAEGRAVMQQALATLQRKDANATPDAIGTLDRFLGMAMVVDGELAQGEKRLASEVADLRATYDGTLPLAKMLLLHGQAQLAMGRYAAAQAEIDEAWRIWQPLGEGAWEPGMANPHHLAQARLLLARGEPAAALERLDRVERPRDAARLPLPLDEVMASTLQAEAWLQQGQPAQARQAAQHALAQVQASPLRSRFATLEADASLRLGQALRQAGSPGAAREHLAHALALRQASDGPDSPWLAEVQMALAGTLSDLGDAPAARALLAQSRAIQSRHAELGEHLRTPRVAPVSPPPRELQARR